MKNKPTESYLQNLIKEFLKRQVRARGGLSVEVERVELKSLLENI